VTEPRPDLKQALYLIADEMRGMASQHKYFAENVYHVERADHLMALAAKVAALVDESDATTINDIFSNDAWLHFSPLIGVDSAVFNPDGEILLIQRKDNASWAMPGGIAEIGETPAEAALRELWEEAGLRGRVVRLLGLFDGRLWKSEVKIHLIHPVFLVECADLNASPGIETLDARFFSRDALPPMRGGHEVRVPKCFELCHQPDAYFDPADSTTGDMPMIQRPQS
jgi:8-oxo-dGTP pyrophosphatase MutT (NUDIX family)